MSYKKLLQEFTPKELAEAFVFPVHLSAKQQREPDRQLSEALQRSRAKMTKEERLAGDLLGLIKQKALARVLPVIPLGLE